MTTLRERSKAEATSNVVFLLQSARWVHTGLPYSRDGEYGYDGEGILLGDNVNGHWQPRTDAEYLTNENLAEMETVDGIPCAIKEWDTVSVFLTRANAKAYGEMFSYRYPNGWRVYGVPSMGLLPTVIERAEAVVS